MGALGPHRGGGRAAARRGGGAARGSGAAPGSRGSAARPPPSRVAGRPRAPAVTRRRPAHGGVGRARRDGPGESRGALREGESRRCSCAEDGRALKEDGATRKRAWGARREGAQPLARAGGVRPR